MQERHKAEETTRLLVEQLTSIRKHIIQSAKTEAITQWLLSIKLLVYMLCPDTSSVSYLLAIPLIPPSTQHAIRIINSRIRFVHRRFAAIFGNTIDVRQRALTELRIDLDDGTSVVFGRSKHTRGIFDCKACVTQVLRTHIFPVPMNKLCECEQGIMHSFIEADYTACLVPVPQKAVPTSPVACEGEGNHIPVLVYECEVCHKKEPVPNDISL